MFTLRPFAQCDAEAIATILRAVAPYAETAADIWAWHLTALNEPRNRFRKLVAVTESGETVGMVTSGHYHWMPEFEFQIQLIVDPRYQHQGIGRQLYEVGLQYALENGAPVLWATCRGDNPESCAWAMRRGFTVERERTESVLDLSDWDAGRFAGDIDRVKASGVRLANLTRDELRPYLVSLYALEAESKPDVPSLAARQFPDYETWLREFQTAPAPQLWSLALDGATVVAESSLEVPPAPGDEATTFYTGVRRSYRGRGLALAVKLLSVEAAIAAGAPRMRTNNDPDNPSMLRVNEKLGYRLVPGPRRLKKTL